MFHARPQTPLKIVASSIAAALAMANFAGCQQYASYPPVEVTASLQRPEAEPVPTIIAETVRFARDRYGVAADLPLNLPEHMTVATYDRVFTHLQGGQPMQFPGEHALHITAIRTRGSNSQVDLIYPTSKGFHEFVTVHLERSMFEKWHVSTDRKWAMGSVTPPNPNYAPAPLETEQTAGATP